VNCVLEIERFGKSISVNTRGVLICSEKCTMVNCAKCGKDIPAGQEVKKGFLMKKSYHKECAPK